MNKKLIKMTKTQTKNAHILTKLKMETKNIQIQMFIILIETTVSQWY